MPGQVSNHSDAEPRDPRVMDLSDLDDTPTGGDDDAPSGDAPTGGVRVPDSDDTSDGDDPAVVDAASEMGWSPKDKWRGDPSQWVDAATFVKRGNMILPIIRKERDELRTKSDAQAQQILELQASSREVAKWFKEQADARVLRERSTLVADRKEALEAGDMERVNEIDIELQEQREKARAAPSTPAKDNSDAVRVMGEFVRDNPIVNKDEEIGTAIVIESRNLRAANSPKQGREFLDAVLDRVKRQYPEKFKTTRGRSQMFETDTSHGDSMPTGAKSFNNLKPDRQQIARKWEKQGVLTIKEYLAECGPEDFRS